MGRDRGTTGWVRRSSRAGELRGDWQQGWGGQCGPADLDLLCLGQTGRGQTPDTTLGNAEPDPQIPKSGKSDFKIPGLEWLCPQYRDQGCQVPQFPWSGGSSLTCTAIVSSQQGKLRLRAQLLTKASPGDKGPGVPSSCPHLSLAVSDPEGGMWWVLEHHPWSRAGRGVLAALWMGWWERSRYVGTPVGHTPPRTLKDTGLRWEERP